MTLNNKRTLVHSDSRHREQHSLERIIMRFGVDAGALQEAAQHHLSRPGKRTRAALFFTALGAESQVDAFAHAAAAIELVHEASLVHDDIQDETDLRRDQLTVWRKFGADTALLLGDHLIAASFSALADSALPPAIKASLFSVHARAISDAASGQHLQLDADIQQAALLPTYRQIAEQKTGALLALPLQFASLILSGREADTQRALRCGQQLGLAYQILDDLKLFNNPSGLKSDPDIINRVVTAPVIAALQLAPQDDPFALIQAQPERHNEIRGLCQGWLKQSIKRASLNADHLPTSIADVVKAFITLRLQPGLQLPATNAAAWRSGAFQGIEAV
ncbi:MAG TPA: hypothetical protein DCP57_08250 [Gammaproteobacteria bacterium]|nr:hypothetical protein [Gammaproteobacteria bacterium]